MHQSTKGRRRGWSALLPAAMLATALIASPSVALADELAEPLSEDQETVLENQEGLQADVSGQDQSDEAQDQQSGEETVGQTDADPVVTPADDAEGQTDVEANETDSVVVPEEGDDSANMSDDVIPTEGGESIDEATDAEDPVTPVDEPVTTTEEPSPAAQAEDLAQDVTESEPEVVSAPKTTAAATTTTTATKTAATTTKKAATTTVKATATKSTTTTKTAATTKKTTTVKKAAVKKAPTDPYDGKTFVIEMGTNGEQVLDLAGGSTAKGTNVQTNAYSKNSKTQKWTLVKDPKSGYYFIVLASTKNNAKPMVLDVKNAGTNVWLYTKNGTDAQLWKLVKSGDGLKIVSKLNPKMGLDIAKAGTTSGSNIQLHGLNGSAAQRFYALDINPEVAGGKTINDGVYEVSPSKATNLSLDLAKGSVSKGGNVQVYTWNGTGAQRLYFEYDGKGYYTVTVVGTGKVLDVQGGNLIPGTNIQQWTRNNSDAQKWAVRKNSDGSYSMINKATGLVFDIEGGTAKKGANLQGYRDNGSAVQKFKLVSREFLADKDIYAIHAHKDGSYGLVFDVKNGSAASGAGLQLWSSNGSLAQRFQVYRVGKDLYRIRTAASGGWITANGTSVVQKGSSKTAKNDNDTWRAVWNGTFWSLTNVATGKDLAVSKVAKTGTVKTAAKQATEPQYFIFTKAALINNGYYIIKSAKGTVLDAQGGGYTNGTNIQTYRQNNTNSQKFNVTAVGDKYRITNVLADKVVEVAGSSKTDKANVQIYDNKSKSSQLWKIEIGDGGYLVFRNANSGKVLDIAGGSSAPKANVQQYKANGSAAQNWKLVSTTVKGWTHTANNNGWNYYYNDGSKKTFSDLTYKAWKKINGYGSGTQYLIAVDNTNCRTFVFEGSKNNWAPKFDWICCVGAKYTSGDDDTFNITPRGVMSIGGGQHTLPGREKGFSMGVDPMEYYWSEFYNNGYDPDNFPPEGCRFHSQFYYGGTFNIIGPNHPRYDNRMGVAITHGCVRLALENAKWIYDYADLGTAVISYPF